MATTVTLAMPRLVRKSRIAVKASPRGTRAGFAVIPDGVGGALTFTVLPRPWAKDRAETSVVDHRPGTTTHITLYELDTVDISSKPGVLERVAEGLLRTVDGTGVEEPARDSYLLERVFALEARPSGGQHSVSGGLEDVARLMLLVKRQRSSLVGVDYRGTLAESLFRFAVQQMFLDEVGRVIDQARPRYRERVESLTTPRGKLAARSLALAIATGQPTIESRFDELSTDTVVLRIVLAALRAVAMEPSPGLLARFVGPIRFRAVGLARRLDSVGILDRERALLAYRRLVVTPLDSPWKSALDLAAEVLERQAVVAEGGEASTTHAISVCLHLENWWEQVLADALRIGADRGTVFEQLPVPSPWSGRSGGSGGTADLCFALDGRTILADAKYKLDKRVIGAADGYQLFAYSHTAESPKLGKPESAAIFYPVRRADDGGTQSLLVRVTPPDFRLHLVGLPFPSRHDMLTDMSWRSYLERTASMIVAALRRSVIEEGAPAA